VIELKNISKIYGSRRVLNGIHLSIGKGEVVAILGPSGSGKSTLLRCINFLEQPDEGEIWVEQEKVEPKGLSKICQKVGMVFQLFHLFPHFSVLKNVAYAPQKLLGLPQEAAEERARKLLIKVGLESKIDAYPNLLSGGQKQRTAIARALAMEPQVMLLDEPTSALDPEMVGEVLEVIQALIETGLTVVMVTHEMAFAKKLASRILFLDEGEIIEDTTPEVFFNRPKSERAQVFLSKIDQKC
jgi:ABC-type polar amino acid transport system ATPase subunit